MSGWAPSSNLLAMAGTLVALLVTLAVLSRVFGESVFSRIAQYVFVGVAAGYAVGLAWLHVLWPRLQLFLADPAGRWPTAVFIILGVLLLVRGVRPSSPLGDAPVSILLGVGAGLALVGAVRGTLAPQVVSAVSGPQTAGQPGWLGIATLVTMALATVFTLAAFHYQRRSTGLASYVDRIVQELGLIGRRLIMLALGAALAGAWLAFFAALQGRVGFVYRVIANLAAGKGLWP